VKAATTIWTWHCAKGQADCEIECRTDEATSVG
jgi:hypothetical protein